MEETIKEKRGYGNNSFVCHLDLKKIIGSSCRQKIINALSKSESVNVMGLVRKINGTYNETNRNLKILEQEDIVLNCYYGRIRQIRLNRENPRTRLLLQALKTLESENLPEI
jgi:DeoR/GlpR family transcriptional regulator of sugar metabolism